MAATVRAVVCNAAGSQRLCSASSALRVAQPTSIASASSSFLGLKGRLRRFCKHQQPAVILNRWNVSKLRDMSTNGDFGTRVDGQPEILEYRVFFADKTGKTISPWHDIPLKAGNDIYNFVVEIPKETSAKFEVATDEPNTPIKQDTKKGKLRFYPYNINWNYGLLPQTWEDPSHANPDVEGSLGDNDPVDVVEIGEQKGQIGEVLKVKPLAVLAMIDEGELDWKVVAICVDDPKANLVNDIDDVEEHFPGTLTAIRDWFRDYKIPDRKPANKFGLGNKAADKKYAVKVIEETYDAWANLMNRLFGNDMQPGHSQESRLDSSSLQRRAVMQKWIALMLSAISLPALATEEEFKLYQDKEDKYSLLVPQDWLKGEGMASLRKVTAFFPENDSSANGLGADFTALGSFGTVDAFAETLVNSLDRAWQRPKGQAAKLIDSRSRNGMYYIEYTIQKPGEAKRHLLSVVGIASNGWTNRLFTVTGQYWEDDSDKYKASLQKAISSFQLG